VRIIESSFEDIGGGRFRLITTFETTEGDAKGRASGSPIGGGPAQTGAVPDRIVHALIRAPEHTLTLTELHQIVEGNPGTVSRQAWTLATNASDLQIRLRGWVFSPERGRYSLTPEAVRLLGETK
jgi:hypothetical protein